MSDEDKEIYNSTVEKGEKIVEEYIEENMPNYEIGKTIFLLLNGLENIKKNTLAQCWYIK
jgi:hypothetical protein